MKPASGFRPLGRLLLPFLLIVCALAAGLAWLGWRVLEQDRTLESQYVQDRLSSGADRVGTLLVGKIVEVEDLLTQIEVAAADQWPARAAAVTGAASSDAVVVVFRAGGVEAFAPSALRFYPVTPASEEAPPNRFAGGEVLEFQRNDTAAAIAFYRQAARSPDVATRAGALVRLARTLRRANQPSAALEAYGQLAGLAPTRLGDRPADLIARHARCAVLEELGRSQELRSEAAALAGNLRSGRWQLTEALYRFYQNDADRWSGPGELNREAEEEALALAAETASLWTTWQGARREGGRDAGRESVRVNEHALFFIRRGNADRLVALVATARFLERQWLAGVQPTLERLNLSLALTDSDGRPVFGKPGDAAGAHVVRSTAETGLPWTLHVASANPAADIARFSARRRFVLAGLALTALLIGVSSYVTARAVVRELAVARLQSDFVSAVSHEFRTPLSTMRQMSELLADGRVPGEERRQQYYEDLRHESERLNRLVENLLDFGRMEAGAREYRFEDIDTAAFVRSVVEEFGHEAAERGYRVEISAADHVPPIGADREALSRALRNLLDNAVKYSPDVKSIWVDARSEGGHVRLSVRDEGVGIPTDEQPRIFDKFVRGASAKQAGIKGTGLGLAMAQRIVAAHGGTISVTSEVGKGSTFTIALPEAKVP